MTRVALAVVLSGLVYPVVLGSVDPWDLAAGVVVAAASVAGFRRHLFPRGVASGRPTLGAILWFVPFAAAAARAIASGAWQVALVVLGARPVRRAGFVDVPVGERSEAGVVAGALVATLSPGEVLVDVDRERGVMVFHAIDASDPDAIREAHDRFYRRYQRRVFP